METQHTEPEDREPDVSAREDAAREDAAQPGADEAPKEQAPRIVVVGPDGTKVPVPSPEDGDEDPHSLVDQPAKVMRIGTMIKQLLDEVRSAPLDDAARDRLASIHEKSLHELEDGLSPELIEELRRITLPLAEDRTPSDAELRVAQAQLVGWLEGLFHGIQTAIVAQQMAAQAQLQQMRRALPHRPQPGQAPHLQRPGDDSPTGQYL